MHQNASFFFIVFAFFVIEFADFCQSSSDSHNDSPPDATPTAHWGYRSDKADEISSPFWQRLFPECSGPRQSPIAINTSTVLPSERLHPIQFFGYDAHPKANNWTVLNNGHVVQFNSDNFASTPSVTILDLGVTFYFHQFHFHWGATDDSGSEHVVNGKRYPLELHIVHSRVGKSEESSDSRTDVAVIGILFEVDRHSTNSTSVFNKLTNAIQQVIDPGPAVPLTLDFTLADLLPDSQSYFRYLGSLTTPPCSESVVWSVMKQSMKITEKQLSYFRYLHEQAGINTKKDHLVDNFRPIQNLNGRVIRSYTADHANMVNTNGRVSLTSSSSSVTIVGIEKLMTWFLLIICNFFLI